MKQVISIFIILILINSLFLVKEMKANNTESFHRGYIKKIDNIPKDYKLLVTMELIYDINIEQCRKIFEKDNIANTNYVDCKEIVDLISADIDKN